MADPSKISGKHQQTVKTYCKAFFDKAASKYESREKRKTTKSENATPVPDVEGDVDAQPFDEASPLPLEDEEASLKRKREGDLKVDGADDGDSSPMKRQKSTPPPPPPPPPPAESPDGDGDTKMGQTDPSPKDSDVNMETPNQNPSHEE